jgi:two-component system, LuxR family, response regulator FixJ
MPPPTRQTICIIDDDESVRRALRRLIQAVGWNAETFATAEEFLSYRAPSKPGCLILDVHLPGLSGLELQERLRLDRQAVAVVFITAYGEDHVREQALRAGAIAFLQKPFEEQALLDAVKRAMDG